MGLIYKISTDFNNKVYIGKTTRDIKTRWQEHINNTSGCNSYLHNSISQHGAEHYKIEILEDNIKDDELNTREKYWIAYYDSQNNGYNLTSGGDGRSLSDQTISLIIDLYQQQGKTCKEISEILNIPHSTIYHRLSQEPWFNKQDNYQRSIKHLCKQIDQYDEQGKFLQTFNSINDASRYLNISNKLISAGIINGYKVYGNYFVEHNCPLVIKTNKKLVGQFDKDTKELLAIFNGAREAARQMNVDSSGIIRACNSNDKKTSKGYVWRYL